MAKTQDYNGKFDSFGGRTLYETLPSSQQVFLRETAFDFRFTFQEFRLIAEIARDLEMWREQSLESWWKEEKAQSTRSGPDLKKYLFGRLNEHVGRLVTAPADYDGVSRDDFAPVERPSKPVVSEQSDKSIWGMCPVASEKTVCCNLRTIDAVENCVFGCSYCTVQTFYTGDVIFDRDFAEKLGKIDIDPERFYHFGTGQASDSLAWGNKNGILDALCEFAVNHPNVLLEFKTKSDNVRYFIDNPPPPNVVCSWSLNTPTVVKNEEHFTAGLGRRLAAARRIADAGIPVAFHFHPMVCYLGWEDNYRDVATEVIRSFDPAEVSFISFGSVTLIKPVVQKIRRRGNPTKITQMKMVPDPHGKLTYADDVKVAMFRLMYETFSDWHDKVFLYLCMEKRSIWDQSFGHAYDSNDEFEAEFGRKTLPFRQGG